MNELKQLPRDADGKIIRQFTANGVEYTIRDVKDILSPKRYLEFSRFTSIFGFGFDFQSLVAHLRECKKDILDIDKNNSSTRMKPLLKIEAIEAAILESSDIKYESSMYLCTIFITEKDEDIRKWDIDEQTKKIDNWAEEGFTNVDFLTLATIYVPQYLEIYSEVMANVGSRNISL